MLWICIGRPLPSYSKETKYIVHRDNIRLVVGCAMLSTCLYNISGLECSYWCILRYWTLVDSLKVCLLAVVLVAAYFSGLIITSIACNCHCIYDTKPICTIYCLLYISCSLWKTETRNLPMASLLNCIPNCCLNNSFCFDVVASRLFYQNYLKQKRWIGWSKDIQMLYIKQY